MSTGCLVKRLKAGADEEAKSIFQAIINQSEYDEMTRSGLTYPTLHRVFSELKLDYYMNVNRADVSRGRDYRSSTGAGATWSWRRGSLRS